MPSKHELIVHVAVPEVGFRDRQQLFQDAAELADMHIEAVALCPFDQRTHLAFLAQISVSMITSSVLAVQCFGLFEFAHLASAIAVLVFVCGVCVHKGVTPEKKLCLRGQHEAIEQLSHLCNAVAFFGRNSTTNNANKQNQPSAMVRPWCKTRILTLPQRLRYSCAILRPIALAFWASLLVCCEQGMRKLQRQDADARSAERLVIIAPA